MTKDDALKLALDALKQIDEAMPFPVAKLAQAAIKEALANDTSQERVDEIEKQRHEPVACVEYIPCCTDQTCPKCKASIKQELVCVCGAVWEGQELIYITPQRKPLTDEEIEDVWANCSVDWDDTINVLTLARAIEAAHGIKENT